MKIDFHVHTNLSVDGVHSPREMVKKAKKTGLDAIAICDHNRIFPVHEAKSLTKEFSLVVIPGIEGGNIAIEKHWIALGICRQISAIRINDILDTLQQENCISIAPHPHTRLGFDAVESLNGSEPWSNRQVRNSTGVPEVAGSDSHALPMLGFCWTKVEADGTLESILESIRQGQCTPEGSTIPFLEIIRFYPLYVRYRLLQQPAAAYAAVRQVIGDVRRVRGYGHSG